MPIAHLSHRAVIRLSGADCDGLLQGIITQDIGLLKSQPMIFSAMLSAQGKFLHDFFIHAAGDDRLIDIDATHKDALVKKLNMYKLRSKVSIIDAPELRVCAAWGGDTPDGFSPDPRLAALGHRALLAACPTICATPDDYEAHRLSLAIPDGVHDASERNFLLELGYDQLHGVSFTKGCYVGQEPTARMHYRHILRKCLCQVSGDALPASGTDLFQDTALVGQMRSSRGSCGLAQLRLDGIESGSVLNAGDSSLTVTIPAYMRARIAALRANETAAE